MHCDTLLSSQGKLWLAAHFKAFHVRHPVIQVQKSEYVVKVMVKFPDILTCCQHVSPEKSHSHVKTAQSTGWKKLPLRRETRLLRGSGHTLITPFLLQQNLTNPPTIKLPYGTTFPNLTDGPSVTSNSCNSYLPSDSTLDRFAAIVNLITANGLYVVSLPCTPVTCDYTRRCSCLQRLHGRGQHAKEVPDRMCERTRSNNFLRVLVSWLTYRELGTVSELALSGKV